MAKPLAIRIMERISKQDSVSVDFLAFELGTTREEILSRIKSLQKSGVIQFDGDSVEKRRSDSHDRDQGPRAGTAA